jgi:DNA-binding response OmpR family regulator
MRLLIIEDNKDLSFELTDYLESQGDIVDTAADGITGLHLAVVNPYEAIVLDLTLPGIDGLELCQRLRQDAGNWVPILMLTARDTLADRIKGFEQGADDYMVKPFSLKELRLRLNAMVRRHSRIHQHATLRVADLELQPDTREVRRGGIPIELTAIEFQILELLMRKSPCVVSRQNLEYGVWGDTPPDGEALRVHIHHLRQAIDKSFNAPLLHTIRGVGYQLKADNGVSS